MVTIVTMVTSAVLPWLPVLLMVTNSPHRKVIHLQFITEVLDRAREVRRVTRLVAWLPVILSYLVYRVCLVGVATRTGNLAGSGQWNLGSTYITLISSVLGYIGEMYTVFRNLSGIL